MLLIDYYLSVEAIRTDGTNQGPIAFASTSMTDPSLSTIDVCVVTSKLESTLTSPGSVSTCLSTPPRTPNHSGSNPVEERVDIFFRIENTHVYHATTVVRIELDESRKLFSNSSDNVTATKPPSLLIFFDACAFRVFLPSHRQDILETHVKQQLRPALAKLTGATSHITDPLILENSDNQEAGLREMSERSAATIQQSNLKDSAAIKEPILTQLKRKAESMESSWKSLQGVEDLLHGPAASDFISASAIFGALATESATQLSSSFTTVINLAMAQEALDQECALFQADLDSMAADVFPAPRRTKSSPTKQSQEHLINLEATILMTKDLMDRHAEAVKRKYSLGVILLARN